MPKDGAYLTIPSDNDLEVLFTRTSSQHRSLPYIIEEQLSGTSIDSKLFNFEFSLKHGTNINLCKKELERL